MLVDHSIVSRVVDDKTSRREGKETKKKQWVRIWRLSVTVRGWSERVCAWPPTTLIQYDCCKVGSMIDTTHKRPPLLGLSNEARTHDSHERFATDTPPNQSRLHTRYHVLMTRSCFNFYIHRGSQGDPDSRTLHSRLFAKDLHYCQGPKR